jgi:hypothetical protein
MRSQGRLGATDQQHRKHNRRGLLETRKIRDTTHDNPPSMRELRAFSQDVIAPETMCFLLAYLQFYKYRVVQPISILFGRPYGLSDTSVWLPPGITDVLAAMSMLHMEEFQ